MPIKFSIITVCFNEEKWIEETCKSISSQTYPNYEWIVIDGASTDKTLEILQEYKPKITQLISEKDKGIYDAMNKGARLATGEYLIFINGGDALYNPNTLNEVFKLNMKEDILFGDQVELVGDSTPTSFKNISLTKKYFLISKHIAHQATFISRRLFEKVGGYDTSYKITGDSEFFTNSIVNYKASSKYLGLIVSRFNTEGMSCDPRNLKKMQQEYKRMNKTHYSTWYILKNQFLSLSFFKSLINNTIRPNVIRLTKATGTYDKIRKTYRRLKYK